MGQVNQNVSTGTAMKMFMAALGVLILMVYFNSRVPSFDSYREKAKLAKADLSDNVSVEGVNFRKVRDYVRVTGNVINSNSVATGVEVKVTAFDAQGNVLTSKEFWPAGTKNITGSYPFEFMFEALPDIDRFEYQIINTRQW